MNALEHPFVRRAQLKQKLPTYWVAKSHGLNHQTLQLVATRHREKFFKSLKYIQANVITGLSFSHGLISCKHDGIGAYFYWEDGIAPIVFHASSLGVEVGLPAAEELAQGLKQQGHTSALIACELVVAKNRSHSWDVIRAIYSPQKTEDLQQLHLKLLDILILDKKDEQEKTYGERVKVVAQLPAGNLAAPAVFKNVQSLGDVNSFYKEELQRGQEGVVVHDLATGNAYKVKPKFNLDLAIVGYVEGTEELVGHVVSIMGALIGDDGTYQLVARVGVADPALRASLFPLLSPHQMNSSYIETDSDGRPIVWVKPTLVMEMNSEEAVWEDTNGTPWTNAVLAIKENSFTYVGQGLIVKPFHPTLERIREDKKPEECTFRQLPGTKLQLCQVKATQPPKILIREVYTKVLKGFTNVKKIVAWSQQGEGVPSFVIHTVDYSAGRADALKEDTKATDFEEEMRKYVEQWRNDEIGKGWEKAA